MADKIMLGEGAAAAPPREQPPIKSTIAVLMDVIDLGLRVEDFPGKPAKLSPKVQLVWWSIDKDSQGNYFELSKEYTNSYFESAKLRKHIAAWVGRALTDAEAKAFDLTSLVGKPCQLSVVAKLAKNGNVYANVDAVTQLHELLVPQIPQMPPYERKEFWASRKQEYADAAAEFKRKQAVANGASLPAPQSQLAAPVAQVTNEVVVQQMIAAEAAQQADLPPF
mgnify:FL=1